MLRILSVLLSVALGSMLAPVAGQAAEPIDPPLPDGARRLRLNDCIDIAIENHPSIQAQRAARGAAVEQQNVARSYFRPQITAEARYTGLDQPITTDLGPPITGPTADVFTDAAAYFAIARQFGPAAAEAALANPNAPPFSAAKAAATEQLPSNIRVGLLGENSLSTQILLLQPLWTGGKISARHAQAQLGVSVADADVVKSRQQTIFDVTQAYYGIQLTNDLEAALAETAGDLNGIERLITSLLEQANEHVSIVDLTRTRTTRLLVETDQTGVVRSRDIAYAALQQAMGIGELAGVEIAHPNLALVQEEVELPDALGEALAQRPELRKARLAANIVQLEQKIARAQYAPDIGLFSRFSTIHDDRQFPNPNAAQEEQIAVGVAGSIPLYTGGRRPAENRRAAWQYAQARRTVELAESLVALELNKAYSEYLQAGEQLPLAREAMEQAKATVEGYRNQYLGGFIDDARMSDYFEDMVAARFLYLQARSRYTQVVFSYNMSLARIRLARGSNDVPTTDTSDAGAGMERADALGRSGASARQTATARH